MDKKGYINLFPNSHPVVGSIPSSLTKNYVYPSLNRTRSFLPTKWLPLLAGMKFPSSTPVPSGLDEAVHTMYMEDEVKCEGSFHSHPLYAGSSEEEGVEQLHGMLAGFLSWYGPYLLFPMAKNDLDLCENKMK